MELSDKLVAAAMKNLEKLLISKGLTAESLISKFDIDGDGLINLDEFDKGLTRLTGSPAPRSYLRPIFSAIDIDGNGDSVGHTLIHTHTGGIADVDIVQSGTNDNMITLTTSGDNADIDISQTD